MNRTNDQPYQTIPAASKITGFSQYFLRNGIKDGSIPHVKCGVKFLVNVPLLMEQMNRQSEAMQKEE